MEARAESPDERSPLSGVPTWILAAGAGLVIAAVLGVLAVVGGDTLPDRLGPPVEELSLERTQLEPNSIELTVRNTGPDPVQVAQVFINDTYVDFSGGEGEIGRLGSDTLTLSYPWQEGQPYAISIVTNTGAVIEEEIPIAVESPDEDGDLFALMALLGLYVGVIPVTLGMLLLPAMRRFRADWVRALMAFTVGLLAFLAVDATLEGFELAGEAGGAFGGAELVVLGAILAYVALAGLESWMRSRRDRAKEGGASPMTLALMIAVGIGLHNMGEGLAIGSAYSAGELALGAFLVIGFAIHNTTEGFAIVAPLTRESPRVSRLLGLGLIAGGPAIIGAVIGVSVSNPEIEAFLLGVGVGAIAQVIVQIAPAMRNAAGRLLDAGTAVALGAGVLLFYLTSLLVTV